MRDVVERDGDTRTNRMGEQRRWSWQTTLVNGLVIAAGDTGTRWETQTRMGKAGVQDVRWVGRSEQPDETGKEHIRQDNIRKNLPGQFAPIIANWQHPPTSGYCVTDSCYCMYIVAPNMKGPVISWQFVLLCQYMSDTSDSQCRVAIKCSNSISMRVLSEAKHWNATECKCNSMFYWTI